MKQILDKSSDFINRSNEHQQEKARNRSSKIFLIITFADIIEVRFEVFFYYFFFLSFFLFFSKCELLN